MNDDLLQRLAAAWFPNYGGTSSAGGYNLGNMQLGPWHNPYLLAALLGGYR